MTNRTFWVPLAGPLALVLVALLAIGSCEPPGTRALADEPPEISYIPTNAPLLKPQLRVLTPPPEARPQLTLAEPATVPAAASEAAAAETAAPEITPQLHFADLLPRLAMVRIPDAADLPRLAALPTLETVVDPIADEPVFELLGTPLTRGTFTRLDLSSTETFAGSAVPSAILVAHGTKPGPVLCLTAAIHGDELNGIETVRQVLYDLDPKRLSGTVIGVPIVNVQGFHRHSRYLPDRRDLNRFFPGSPTGSSASRIAYALFNEVILRCNALVDLHTGSFHRTNLPQLRADLNNEQVVAVTKGFGSTVILHGEGEPGTLRRAATDVGIPAVTLEAGMPLQVQADAVAHSVKGIQTLLDTMKMYSRRSLWGNPEPVYYQSRWVRSDHGGILSGAVRLGREVQRGDLLGTIIDPISNESIGITSPYRGRVIGMALDQFVMPGYATFHIGIASEVADATDMTHDSEADHGADEYSIEMEEED